MIDRRHASTAHDEVSSYDLYRSPMPSPGKRTLTAGLIARKAERDDNGVAADADVAVDRAAGTSGSPLPDHLRGQFEASTGADLSGVRVHTGAESAEASHAVGAKAYTTGQDIHFGAGYYDPSSAFGVHLLAHEVAHTVQQQGGASSMQHKLEVSAPQDSAELEADRAADAMVNGAAAEISNVGVGAARKAWRDGDPAATAAADKTYPVAFTLDFQELPSGKNAVQKLPQRDPKATGLYLDLDVSPDGGGASLQTLKAVNAKPTGRASIGSIQHPADKKGKLSGRGKYGGKPGKKIDIKITESIDPKDKDANKAAKDDVASMRAEIDAAITPMLTADTGAVDGGLNAKIQAKAQEIAAKHSTGVEVTASFTETAPAGAKDYPFPSTAYPVISAASTFDIIAKVPLTEKLEGSVEGGTEGGEGTKEKSTDNSKNAVETQTVLTTEETNTLATNATSAIKSAYQEANKKVSLAKFATKNDWEVSDTKSIEGQFGGKVNLSLAFDKILRSGPPWLKLISFMKPEGSAEVTGSIKGGITQSSGSSGGVATEATQEQVDELTKSMESEIKNSVTTENVKKTMTSSKLTLSIETSKGNEKEQSKNLTKKNSWVMKTVNWQVGDPILTLEKQ